MSSDELEHFTVEITEQSEVFIYLEKSALDMMIRDLQRLQSAGDHTHYMSEAWGGVSLSSEPFDSQNKMSNHLQLILLDSKAKS